MPTSLSLDANLDQAVGLVRYNGFYFPPARHATIDFVPEYSDDGRTVKYIRADLTLDFILVEGMGGDGTITGVDDTPTVLADSFVNLRQRLSKPGQPLYFTVQGIGDFEIQNGTYYDVNNGPRPQVVRWVPISNKAAHIIWRVSTWFADCSNQNGLTGAAQFPFSVSWNIADNGLLTRTITGTLEVPLSRNPSLTGTTAQTALRQSADIYREQIYNRFPPLARFMRTTSWNLSPDRKSEQFTITDSEIGSDNPFFPGVVRIRGNRSYSANLPFIRWSGLVSLSIEIAPGYSRLRAWWVFLNVFNDIFGRRGLGHFKTSGAVAKTDPGNVTGEKDSYAWITNIDIDEELYGRTFSIRCRYLLTCSLRDLFKATGLFEPLGISQSTASWNLWRASMSPVQSARGWLDVKRPNTAGGRFNSQDDLIVDICTPSPDALGTPIDDPNPRPERSSNGSREQDRKLSKIDPDKSFIHYENDFRYINEEGTVISVPLQKSSPVKEEADTNKTESTEDAPGHFPLEDTTLSSSLKSPTLHRIRPRLYRVVIEGRGLRIGYPVPVPNLVSIGGAIARKTGTDIIKPKVILQGTEAISGEPYTLYGCYWRKEYILETRPQNTTIVTDGHVVNYT